MAKTELIPDNPQLPHDWTPFEHQNRALTAFNGGLRRQIHIWHRRAGKDSFGLNLAAIESQRKIGTYWHLFPLQTQAKKAIWHGIDAQEQRIIDHVFPEVLRKQTLQDEMLIKFKNGSTWQMAGSDRYNSLVGSNVLGVVFSEWALCNPLSWDYIRPIIRENKGWVMFITTYRGKNHAYQMYENLKDHGDWYCTKLTVDDTRRHDGTPILSAADIQLERDEGMSESMIQQEYYCSPEASYAGSYYAKEMYALNESKRRGAFGYDPQLPLYAAFDRSTSSVLACVLVQPVGNMHNIVASKTWENMTIQNSFSDLREMLPFGNKISKAIMPPGANIDHFKVQGVEFYPAPDQPLIDGIDIVRHYLPLTRVDVQIQAWAEEGNNIELLNSLQGYRAQPDANHVDMFTQRPAFVPEIWLANAFLNYCVFADSGGVNEDWSSKPDYTLQDRSPGVHQGVRLANLNDWMGYKRESRR